MIIQHPDSIDIPSNITLPDFVFRIHGNQTELSQLLDSDAFIDGDTGEKITHRQLRDLSNQLASGIYNKLNIRKGDCIAIFLPNCIQLPIIFLGALALGVVVTTINPMYTEKEVSHQLKDSNAKLIFAFENGLEVAQNSVNKIRKSCKVISLGKASSNCTTLADIYCTSDYPKLSFKTNVESKDTVALIAYSSGTTGLPKGVVTTHYNLISNLMQCEHVLKGSLRLGMVASGVLPFFHCYGIMVNMLIGTHSFLKTVVIPKFEFTKLLGIIQGYKVELLSLAPPVILLLAKSPLVEGFDLTSIKYILSGAAPLPADVGNAAKKRLGCCVAQGYGMTEASPVITIMPFEEQRVESAGRIVPNMKAKIVDPLSGKTLGINETGELWVSGPNIMKGYFNNTKATQEMFDSDNYMRTGDVGYFDSDRNLFIVDRVKELIKYKGYQVAPAELEEVLLSHPKVKDCCVIGIPDPATGEEIPKGFVALNLEGNLTPSAMETVLNEIKEASHKKLAFYKHFRGGIEAIDAIPKSPTGKILRRLLRDKEMHLRKAKL